MRKSMLCAVAVLVLAGCTAGEEVLAVPPIASVTAHVKVPFALKPGHCSFYPVKIEGESWEVAAIDQFGWGDAVRWSGRGVLKALGDGTYVFQDRTGKSVHLYPASDPRTRQPGDYPYCY
ncbi:MAG: hypothetical protein ABI586_09970 [Candidatus Nanopelagicales bacterium]